MKLYQHFKGGLYVVTGSCVINADNTKESSVEEIVYFGLTGMSEGMYFTRPLKQFHENVEHEGKVGPRFRYIADPADIMPEGGHP
jgi:hypothetical protein